MDLIKKRKDRNMNASNTQIQMRKGLLEFCILHIISRGEVYASDMIEELTEAKMIVVEGTLYPLLQRLKNASLVTYKWVESESGPPRKYYSITEEGENFLKTLNETWESLVQSTQLITSKQ
jgi:PadR family transcriptional regulator, regulatory protein PadR